MFKRETLGNTVVLLAKIDAMSIGHVVTDDPTAPIYVVEKLTPSIPFKGASVAMNQNGYTKTQHSNIVPINSINELAKMEDGGTVYSVPASYFHQPNTPLCILDIEFNGHQNYIKFKFIDKSKIGNHKLERVEEITIADFGRDIAVVAANHAFGSNFSRLLVDDLVKYIVKATECTIEEASCFLLALFGTDTSVVPRIIDLLNGRVSFRIIPTVGIFLTVAQDTFNWLSGNKSVNVMGSTNAGHINPFGWTGYDQETQKHIRERNNLAAPWVGATESPSMSRRNPTAREVFPTQAGTGKVRGANDQEILTSIEAALKGQDEDPGHFAVRVKPDSEE